MKKLLLFLFLVPAISIAQEVRILNCDSILVDGMINSNSVSGANTYEFELTNVTTSQTMIYVSNVPSVSLLSFAAIITYQSYYKVRVRVNTGTQEEPRYSRWSEYCQFYLDRRPETTSISNIACDSTITDLNMVIEVNPIYDADCYTFYVTNLSTSQSANTGCISQNYFTLASLGILFNYNDTIEISVSYSIKEREFERSEPCRFLLHLPRPFCEVIREQMSIEEYNETHNGFDRTATSMNVGNLFFVNYWDNGYSTQYAPAVWESDYLLILDVVEQVLLDLEDFLVTNVVDPSCGDINQRWAIDILPYTQLWVDEGFGVNALAVAAQGVDNSLDINFLSQTCGVVPNIQLALAHGTYGDFMYMPIGTIFINPAIANYNYNYALPEGSFPGEFDLYSVILHEITHIFGIANFDSKFQEFIHANDVSGPEPLYNPGLFDCGIHSNFSSLSTSTCTDVFFDGTSGQEELHAPALFDPASSLAHFPDDCGSTSLGDNVMNPGIFQNEAKRCYHQREVNALQDLGFNFSGTFNSCSYSVNNTPYIIGYHDGLLVQADPDEGFMCDDLIYTPISNPICGTWPLALNPLSNDVNADYIAEAVIKTGAPGATVNIISGTSLAFNAAVPGVYTIGYVPASNITGRKGLPTYIQIWVTSCGDGDLTDLLCNNSGNCSQICFDNTIAEHTILRGNNWTQPSGFNVDDEFSFGAMYGEVNSTSGYTSSYGSVFFWVDTDPLEEYSISYDRQYHELAIYGSYSNDPVVEYYVYLVKSTDMIGLVNHSSNNFSALPANKQLLAKEKFINPITYNPYEVSSFCFTANDDYDMLIFYAEQVSTMDFSKVGIVTIKNLELMKKEFPDLPNNVSACIPETLELGEEFCAVSSSVFKWKSWASGAVLSSNQIYSPGTISSPIIDQYTFTMSYPTLPSAMLFPTENASCSENHAVSIVYDDCCVDTSVPIYHPLTCYTYEGRTFGEDVDADANGALYYCGEFTHDINIGSLSAVNTIGYPDGFLAKIGDNCGEWIVNTGYRYSNMEVADAGRIFYAGRTPIAPFDYFAEFNSLDGSVIWSWNITSGNPFITDFELDEVAEEIIIVGYSPSGFVYNSTSIGGTSADVFVLRLDFDGNYIDHEILPGSSGNGIGRVATDGTKLYVAQTTTTISDWTLHELNYTTLVPLTTPAPRIIDGGTAVFNMTALEISGTDILAQVVYDADVVDVISPVPPIIDLTNVAGTGYIKFSSSLVPTGFVFEDLTSYFFSPFFGLRTLPDMSINGGTAYFSYDDDDAVGHILSVDVSSGLLNWTQTLNPVNSLNDALYSKSIKSTPSGIYNTGVFSTEVNIDGYIIYANEHYSGGFIASFYGVKYDPLGSVTAMILNDDNTLPNFAVDHEVDFLNKETQNSELSNVSVYPNPGNDIFTIAGDGDYHVTINDINGRLIQQFNATGRKTFDLSQVTSGLYLVTIVSQDHTQIIKLVKE